MSAPLLCLVTIHGIGFQQPPLIGASGYPDTPGYADALHEHLSQYLNENLLCDDPFRQRHQPGQNGPIYVQNVWPPGSHRQEEGLHRLGTWDASQNTTIIGSQAQLCNGNGRIAHIALVYSQLEGQGSQLRASLLTAAMVLASLRRYSRIMHLIRTFCRDVGPLLRHAVWSQTNSPSLRIRQDPGFWTMPKRFMATIRQLENDVATYVVYNDVRERVRNFVWNALLLLAGREDVGGIIINGHSNGTVIALDILHDLPPFAAGKVVAFITAGSPLRKYTDLFAWGDLIDTTPKLACWINFLDHKDPVADPMAPSAEWIGGTPITPAVLTGLYKSIDPDTGELSHISIKDIVVDNLAHSSGGGLQAHNYWDNTTEFVQPLADLLKQACA